MARLAAKHLFIFYLNVLVIPLIYALATSSDQCVVPGCTNYWNFEKNFIDQKNPSIGFFNSHNASWVSNRRGEKESALYLNNGYIQINISTVSWTGDFSIAAWVYVKTRVACGKLFDCGIKGQNELVINLNSCNGDGLSLQLYTNRSVSEFVYNRNRLEAKWQHVAFTFNSGKIVIYTDGVPVASGKTNVKPNVNSNYGTCSIGKSLWNNPNINAYIDDLWMFNRGLSADEVQIVMNISITVWTSSTTKIKISKTSFSSSVSSSTTLSSSISSTQTSPTKTITNTSMKTTSVQTTSSTTSHNTTETTTISLSSSSSSKSTSTQTSAPITTTTNTSMNTSPIRPSTTSQTISTTIVVSSSQTVDKSTTTQTS